MDRFVKIVHDKSTTTNGSSDSSDPKIISLNDKSWIITGRIPLTIQYNFDELWNLHPENHDKILMYGKEIEIPRYQSNYLKDYKFAGKTFPGKLLPSQFQPFLDWANSLGFGLFNGVLINFYENKHYIGQHRDNTDNLVNRSPIVSISLGEKRLFRIRKSENKTRVLDIEMRERDYIIMCGDMQKDYTHEIVKITGKKLLNTGNRINVTFRIFK